MNPDLATKVLTQLEDLTYRIEAIEKRLSIQDQQTTTLETPSITDPPEELLHQAEIPREVLLQVEPAALIVDPLSNPPAAVAELRTTPFLSPEHKRARLTQFVQLNAQPTPTQSNPDVQIQVSPTPPQRESDSVHLERSIAARWYAGAGALIVVAGISLFIKLAFDRGWFSIAPAVRCLLGVAFGGGLIALAEIVRKRITPLAAVGLYAAGLGGIFASTYAAYRMYALLDAPIAFTLLGLVGLFGVAISIRAKLPIVGVLSLVAGFATPFLFFDSPPRPFVLPLYTLTLMAVGLSVTAWKGASYVNLRRVAWWGTIINGTIWLMRIKPEYALSAMIFLAFVWILVHAELTWSAVHNKLNIPSKLNLYTSAQDILAWRSLLMSFTTSAWALAFAIRVLSSWQTLPTWLAPAALMAATACLAIGLAGFPRPFIEKPSNDLERFAACLVLQSVAALIATVTLAFTGVFEIIAWGLLAVSVLIAARWLRSRPFYAFALTCLVIATARLVLYDSHRGTITASPVNIAGLCLSLWTLCMACCAGLWWMAARFIADEPVYATRRMLPVFLAGIGCVAILASVVIGSTAQSLAYVWVLCAVAFTLVDKLDRRLGMLDHAFIAASAAACAVFIAFPWVRWENHFGLIHPGIVAGIAVVTVFAFLGMWARRTPIRLIHSRIAFAAGTLMLFVISSLDVARLAERISHDATAQRSALSIWWAIFGVALIAAGFWRRISTPRYVGLALLGIAALKAVILDLAGVPQTWRVASLIGIGLLMLAVGVAYSKLTSILIPKRTENEPNADNNPTLEAGVTPSV